MRLDSNASNDNGIVLLDARRAAGCANDEVWRGTGSIPIGNALSNSTCQSEAAVFSNHHAVQFLPAVTTWTDAVGDLLPVPLTPLLQSPIAVFVLRPPFTTAGGTGHGDTAADDLGRATYLYGSMNCGVALQSTIIDATAHPNAPGLLTRKCSQAASLRTLIGFQPGKLNAYYIYDVLRDDDMGSAKGANCGLVLATTTGMPAPTADDWNTILVSTTLADAESLAHEIGHAFSLRHTNMTPAQSDERRNHRARQPDGRPVLPRERQSGFPAQCQRCAHRTDEVVSGRHDLVGMPGAVTRRQPEQLSDDDLLPTVVDERRHHRSDGLELRRPDDLGPRDAVTREGRRGPGHRHGVARLRGV